MGTCFVISLLVSTALAMATTFSGDIRWGEYARHERQAIEKVDRAQLFGASQGYPGPLRVFWTQVFMSFEIAIE